MKRTIVLLPACRYTQALEAASRLTQNKQPLSSTSGMSGHMLPGRPVREHLLAAAMSALCVPETLLQASSALFASAAEASCPVLSSSSAFARLMFPAQSA